MLLSQNIRPFSVMSQKRLIVGAIDKYGIYEFYKKYCTKLDRLDFVRTCLSEAECTDLIQVHSRSDIFLANFGPQKKMFSTINLC